MCFYLFYGKNFVITYHPLKVYFKEKLITFIKKVGTAINFLQFFFFLCNSLWLYIFFKEKEMFLFINLMKFYFFFLFINIYKRKFLLV